MLENFKLISENEGTLKQYSTAQWILNLIPHYKDDDLLNSLPTYDDTELKKLIDDELANTYVSTIYNNYPICVPKCFFIISMKHIPVYCKFYNI